MLKLPPLQKLMKIFLDLLGSMINQPNLKKTDLVEQNEELIEPHRVNNSKLYDIQILMKFFPENFSCANLQLHLKTMQHSSSETQSAGALLKQVFTLIQNHDIDNFSFLMNSYIKNKKFFFCIFYDFILLKKCFFS